MSYKNLYNNSIYYIMKHNEKVPFIFINNFHINTIHNLISNNCNYNYNRNINNK